MANFPVRAGAPPRRRRLPSWAANCSLFMAAACSLSFKSPMRVRRVRGRLRSAGAALPGHAGVGRRLQGVARRRQGFPSPGGLRGVLQLLFHGVGRLGLDLLGALAAVGFDAVELALGQGLLAVDVLQLAFAFAQENCASRRAGRNRRCVRARRARPLGFFQALTGAGHETWMRERPSRTSAILSSAAISAPVRLLLPSPARPVARADVPFARGAPSAAWVELQHLQLQPVRAAGGR